MQSLETVLMQKGNYVGQNQNKLGKEGMYRKKFEEPTTDSTTDSTKYGDSPLQFYTSIQ